MSGDAITTALRRHRFRFTSEAELQAGIALALESEELPVAREVELFPGSRIDFLVGRVGVEVKVDGSLGAVTRQLHRYAESDRVDALVLVSSRNRHARQPGSMSGKPLRVVILGGML